MVADGLPLVYPIFPGDVGLVLSERVAVAVSPVDDPEVVAEATEIVAATILAVAQ